MKSLSNVGLGLSVVFGCLFLALVAELYYLWWKKRIKNGEIENPKTNFCSRKIPSFSTQTSLNPQQLTPAEKQETPLQNQPSKDSILKQPFGEDGIETEIMRLHNLSGPPRFLFTITEETKEDLDSEEVKSKGDKSREGSRDKSLSTDFVFTVETPYLTPLASPSFFTPPLTPTNYSFEESGFNPLLKSTSDEELQRVKSSPPPKFKFLQEAEEKMRRKSMEEAKWYIKDEEDGSFFSVMVDRNKEMEIIRHPSQFDQYLSSTSLLNLRSFINESN